MNAEKAGRAGGRVPALPQRPAKPQEAYRPRLLKEPNQAGDRIPASRQRHRDRVKVLDRRRSNEGEAGANPGNDLRSRVEQVALQAHPWALRHQLSKLHRRSLSMVVRQRENWARPQLPVRAGPSTFRRRVAAEDLSLNSSARRLAQGNVVPAPEVRRLKCINPSRHRLVEGLLVKRVAQEKEDKALVVSRPRRSKVARLPLANAARASRKAERKSRRKKHHRQGHANSDGIYAAASE